MPKQGQIRFSTSINPISKQLETNIASIKKLTNGGESKQLCM